MFGPFPAVRPKGLRRRSLAGGTELWRIDADDPGRWSWAGFDAPRHRFDPASGMFRVRYAATSLPGAARERYRDTANYVPADHADHHLVHLVAARPLSVLDLRTESTLDVLDVDDRINTGHEPDVWDACHRLADSARAWWPDLDGILFRSRTTPETSANLAFLGTDGLTIDARVLHACVNELDELVLRHQFTIGFTY